MLRFMNLIVLFLNLVVLILGQLPENATNSKLYRLMVYILIIFLTILLSTDLLHGIISFFYSIKKGTEISSNLSIIIELIAVLFAIILLAELMKLEPIKDFIQLIQ